MRTLMLMAAVALMSTFSLVAGAVTDSKREHSSGLDRAREVASENAHGLQIAAGQGAAVPVPEPSSLVVFATGMIVARSWLARRRVSAR